FQHQAGVSPYTSTYIFARSCVFSKQSLLSGVDDHLQHIPKPVGVTAMVPLLPKLRGHFAEFLNHDSIDHLSILYSTTCCGYRVRATHSLTPMLFSAAEDHQITPPTVGRPSALTLTVGTDLPTPTCYNLRPGQPSHGLPTFLRHTTRLPSPLSGPTPPSKPDSRRCPGRSARLGAGVLVRSVWFRYR